MKKVLALILAFTLVMSMGVTALAAAPATGHTDSDTQQPTDAANPAGDGDGYKIGADLAWDEDNDFDTAVYLNVDQDALSDQPIPGVVTGGGKEYFYEVETATDPGRTIDVTVPLYICMFAYGGDGKVVTPADNAYQLKNKSTEEKKVTITKIDEYQKVYDNIWDIFEVSKSDWDSLVADSSNTDSITFKFISADEQVMVGGANATYAAIDAQWSSLYGNTSYSWYVDPTTKEVQYVLRSNCKEFTKDDATVTCRFITTLGDDVATKEAIKVAPDTTNAKNYKKGDTVGSSAVAAIALQVSSVKVDEQQGWSLVDNTSTSDMLARQLKMTLNGLDLYLAVGTAKAVSGNTWKLDAATGDVGSLTAYAKNMPITASIAGGGVNEDFHNQVLYIKYTFAPVATDPALGG